MVAGGLRGGARGPDDLHRGSVAALRFRRVEASEADEISAALAGIHEDALSSGMALGVLESMRPGLRRAYCAAVASLDERERLLIVAEDDARVVGMAQLAFSGAANAAHRAEVQRVGVAASARGHGVGRELMSAIEQAALEHGVSLLWLTTHDGTEACSFYEAIGYTKLGVMPNYSRRPDGTLWTAAFYFKDLSA